MLAGIREVLIITTPQDANDFKNLLGDGSSIGIAITYEQQPKPEGLAQAFIIGEKFIGKDSVALILGDNIFYGSGLGRRLSEIHNGDGATIFGFRVSEPERYGVAEVLASGKVVSIEEKPAVPKSDIAIPGLYFFDNTVVERARYVTKSLRGELEITSVINSYLMDGKLILKELEKGTAWMDCGTVDSMNEAANYIKSVEQDLNYKIGCLEEVAFKFGWINKSQLSELARSLGNNEYAKYLGEVGKQNQ
jgi:glucose-1-phosphate thymidylyltransferase